MGQRWVARWVGHVDTCQGSGPRSDLIPAGKLQLLSQSRLLGSGLGIGEATNSRLLQSTHLRIR